MLDSRSRNPLSKTYLSTLLIEVLKIKNLFRLVRAEMLLVYADFFRRKIVMITYLAWPYMTTTFMLMIGYAVGSPQAFAERVGVEPALFLIVGSYLLFSSMSVVDDIMWRPIFDESVGTLPYIISSPAGVVLHYLSIPIPRFVLSLVLGLTTLFPVLVVLRGLSGVLIGLIVMFISVVSVATFVPLATALGLGLYVAGGENWRAINFLRPLLLILVGVYYPRWLMSLPLYIVSSLIPPAHCVEVVQRIVVGLAEASAITVSLVLALFLGLAYSPGMLRATRVWELRKLREGVKT
ncbi:MAG: hypothetical protein QXK66_04160 [Sulfolobales archaeon]